MVLGREAFGDVLNDCGDLNPRHPRTEPFRASQRPIILHVPLILDCHVSRQKRNSSFSDLAAIRFRVTNALGVCFSPGVGYLVPVATRNSSFSAFIREVVAGDNNNGGCPLQIRAPRSGPPVLINNPIFTSETPVSRF